jgi:dTDP-4-dehydrorhamnose 3,5-epimerase
MIGVFLCEHLTINYLLIEILQMTGFKKIILHLYKKALYEGLHFQLPPYCETKLVRCIKGKILDVFVDLRTNSSTFGKWDSIVLSEENKTCIYIPKGFAHGFCTLTNNTEVLYKVDNYYNKENECGLLWNDPNINIRWPLENVILSEKDKINLTFNKFKELYKSITI